MEEDLVPQEMTMVHHIALMSKYYLYCDVGIKHIASMMYVTWILNYHCAGILHSETGEFLNMMLAPEEIGLALLPPSLFETLPDDEIGLFFTLYESALFFPLADVPSTATMDGTITRIGSPVVAATVVTDEQDSFSDLSEPVIVAVRLNPVPEGVSWASF